MKGKGDYMKNDVFEITNDDIQKIDNELKELYNEVCNIIYEKYNEYFKKFGQPKFVKFPETLYLKLYHFQETLREIIGYELDIDFNYSEIFEMTICPSSSINTLEEIEVF